MKTALYILLTGMCLLVINGCSSRDVNIRCDYIKDNSVKQNIDMDIGLVLKSEFANATPHLYTEGNPYNPIIMPMSLLWSEYTKVNGVFGNGFGNLATDMVSSIFTKIAIDNDINSERFNHTRLIILPEINMIYFNPSGISSISIDWSLFDGKTRKIIEKKTVHGMGEYSSALIVLRRNNACTMACQSQFTKASSYIYSKANDILSGKISSIAAEDGEGSTNELDENNITSDPSDIDETFNANDTDNTTQ